LAGGEGGKLQSGEGLSGLSKADWGAAPFTTKGNNWNSTRKGGKKTGPFGKIRRDWGRSIGKDYPRLATLSQAAGFGGGCRGDKGNL